MKHFFITLLIDFLVLAVNAQHSIKGYVYQQQTKDPVEAATVYLKGNNTSRTTSTTSAGSYEFKDLSKGLYEVIVEHISMQPHNMRIKVEGDVADADFHLEPQSYYLEPLEVKSLRASEKSPFAKTNISKAEIAKNNLGQDLPFLLNQTPGVVVNSDAGNGIGYTALRIRGSDATRINVTVNGIPYNDAESQGSFFVDLPDIASSLNSIQIQRGAGTSSNGAGAFGASINLSTNELNEKPYGQFSNSYGSFNSWKNTIKVGTGLLNKHFTVDARLSRINSNGFIDRAATDMKSLFLSTAYINNKSTLRFNFISGVEKTYQAWYGIEQSILDTNRRYNPAGMEKPGAPYNNQTDNYQQNHSQLFFNHSFSDKLSFNTAVFLTKGKGYYEEYKGKAELSNYGLDSMYIGDTAIGATDLVRQLWLDNNFYGQIFSLQYKTTRNLITLGGGWNRYEGNHFGRIVWAETAIPKDYEWYRLTASKTDVNAYAKVEHALNTHVYLYGDLQYRNVDYTMNGFRNNPNVFVKRKFDFINPKAGISYYSKGLKIYGSYALANKEPNRDDYEAGIAQQPKHETMHDFEAGVERTSSKISWGANLYYMLYKNQLILTGQINDVGAYTRVNIPDSYRAGIELQAKAKVVSWMNGAVNLALSRNKIKQSDVFIDNYDNGTQVKMSHANTDISFSPAVVGGVTLNFIPLKNAEISLISKYVSRQYLDNTQNEIRSLNAYYVQDIRLNYTVKNKLIKECSIICAVNNIWNTKYEPNGYTFSYIYGGNQTTVNYYFPMAGFNFMAGLNISL